MSECVGTRTTSAEHDTLPCQVFTTSGRARLPRTYECPVARHRFDQTFSYERRHRMFDGQRTDTMPRLQFAHGRKASSGSAVGREFPQALSNAASTVIVFHENQ